MLFYQYYFQDLVAFVQHQSAEQTATNAKLSATIDKQSSLIKVSVQQPNWATAKSEKYQLCQHTRKLKIHNFRKD